MIRKHTLDTPPDTGDNFINNRIIALRRQGAIERLRDESRTIRNAVADRLRNNYQATPYGWVEAQLDRAEAYDREADRLDGDRPAGAAGLAS